MKRIKQSSRVQRKKLKAPVRFEGAGNVGRAIELVVLGELHDVVIKELFTLAKPVNVSLFPGSFRLVTGDVLDVFKQMDGDEHDFEEVDVC